MDELIRTLTDNLHLFLDAFRVTAELFLVAACASLVVGTSLAAMRISPVPAFRFFATGYVTLLRNTPLTLVFFFVAFGFPYLQVNLPFVVFAMIALSAYTSAFVCE